MKIAGCSIAGFTGSLVGSTCSEVNKKRLAIDGTLFGCVAGVFSGMVAGGVVMADLAALDSYAESILPLSMGAVAIISALTSAYHSKLFGNSSNAGALSDNADKDIEMERLQP